MTAPLDTLNIEQQTAVTHPAGPMRIVAGAGTGKTQTLTRRFAALVESGTPEHRILALTFTTKAAAEMRRRVLDLPPHGHRKLWIQTFHAFCRSLIDEWNRAAGLPPPQVISAGDQMGYAIEAIAAIPDNALLAHAGIFGKQKLAADLLTLSSQARDLLMHPVEVTAYARAAEHPPGRLHDLALAYTHYTAYLHQKGLHDFPQLGYQAVHQLKSDPALLERTRSRFDHVLVDEFQDTNLAQFELIRLLVPQHGNICVVGDENQAIYAFRGGNPQFIATFEDYFPNTATYHLTTNYRSGQSVLDAANRLITHNNPANESLELKSWPPEKASTLTVTSTANPDLEAEHIARTILSLVRRPESPWRYTDIAILLRSTDRLSAPIRQALIARGIPFQIGGEQSVHAEPVHDALAALRLVVGPARWRDAARLAAHQGVSAVQLRGIESRALTEAERDALLTGDGNCSDLFTASQRQTIAEVRALANKAATLRHLPLPDLTYQALVLSGRLDAQLQPNAARTLSSFIEHATTLAGTGGSAEELVTHLTAGYGDLPHQTRAGVEGVQILTVHSAKGLEWPVVFLAGMADGQFPLPMKLDRSFDFDTLHDWQDGGKAHQTETARQERFRQEERRLAYVAITRAQTELHITYPVRDETGRTLNPSPFIHEIGLFDTTRALTGFDIDGPPASMTDLARQLRMRRNQALSAPIDDPDAANHLAAVLLSQWAALSGIDGATLLRDRAMPDPFGSDQPLWLSFSQLNTYETCPRQYCYSRVMRLDDPEESPHLSMGSAVHSALEELNALWMKRGVPPGELEIEASIERHWPERGFQFEAQGRQLRLRAGSMLRRYYSWEQNRSPMRHPVATEQHFETTYGPHTISGRIDAVMESEDGSVEIVDYKASKRDSPTLKQDESLQLFLYDHAWRKERPESNPSVAFYALRHDNDKGFDTGDEWDPRQVKSLTHTDESRAVLAERLDDLIEGLESNNFDPRPTYETCNRCPYRWLCPEG